VALNPTSNGDAIAAYVKANAPVAGTPVTDAALKSLWEGIQAIVFGSTGGLAVGTVTIPSSAIVTTGGPTTQTGPAAPVPLTGVT
jgi:hypothetical protein